MGPSPSRSTLRDAADDAGLIDAAPFPFQLIARAAVMDDPRAVAQDR